MKIELRLSLAWWFWPYAHGLALVCGLCGRQPDLEKFRRVIRRAIRIRLAR